MEAVFYQLLNEQMRMVDFEDYSQIGKFEQQAKKLIAACDTVSSVTLSLMIKGSTFFFISFLEARQKNWFTAFRNARSGAASLETLLKIDSTVYEAYIALGAYKYWKSVRSGILGKVGIFRDERQLGISMLQKAIARLQNPSIYLARDQLSWIYLNERKPSQALRLARANIDTYPHSRFLQWTYMEVLEQLKQYKKSLPLAMRLNDFYWSAFPYGELNFLITLKKSLLYCQKLIKEGENPAQELSLLKSRYNHYKQKKLENNQKKLKLIKEIDLLWNN